MDIIKIIETLCSEEVVKKFSDSVISIEEDILSIDQNAMHEIVDENPELSTRFVSITQTGYNSKKIEDSVYSSDNGQCLLDSIKHLQLFNGRGDLKLSTITEAIFNNYKIPLMVTKFVKHTRPTYLSGYIVEDNDYNITLAHPSIDTKNFTFTISELFNSAIRKSMKDVKGDMSFKVGKVLNLCDINPLLSPFVLIFVDVVIDKDQMEHLLKNGFIEVAKEEIEYEKFTELIDQINFK